jgi:hypothetical protein
VLRDYFRNSSWEYAHVAPTALLTATVLVLLVARFVLTRRASESTMPVRVVNALVIVSVVLFGLVVYARFVTFA